MGQQVKSWCRQHERLLIFISFLLLSGLSLYFVYFQENFLRASDFRFHQNRVEGLASAIKNNDWFPKINYFSWEAMAMPLVCFIQMRIFIYLRFCVFWGFPLSLVWRFLFLR